ncbi:hypothetical protein P7B02_13200 [Caulobacter segnis]|uniref:hypothetical protein n=1 Tax=Caulobacter segnis TaxID=88688 RepID=UPI00240FC110|nr:hypothetical protein [Caulobacter segnis]MDG2522502.1 hypothetical protein [Caulobacter segnis]
MPRVILIALASAITLTAAPALAQPAGAPRGGYWDANNFHEDGWRQRHDDMRKRMEAKRKPSPAVGAQRAREEAKRAELARAVKTPPAS